MVRRPSSGSHDTVRIWHAQTETLLARGDDAVRRGLTLLQPAERARYDRFRHDADRHMFLLGRIMARALVADALQVPALGWPWREGLRGRPEVDADDCPISFNLAHSGGVVVCALSWLGTFGVDVEDRGRVSLDRGLIARCCDGTEAADIEAHGPAWGDRFLQYWTLKESYLKAVGLGISVHLPDVRFDLARGVRSSFQGSLAGADRGWTFALTTMAPRHYVAVAAQAHHVTSTAIEHAPFPEHWWP